MIKHENYHLQILKLIIMMMIIATKSRQRRRNGRYFKYVQFLLIIEEG